MHVWKDFSSGDGNLSSPGCTGSMYDPRPISERPVEGIPTPCCEVFYHRDHRFCPQIVGVVKVLNEFGCGNETISSPGAVGPRHWPQGQLSPRADRMSASQSAITQGGLGFYTVRGGVYPGDLRFQSQIVRVVEICKAFRSKDETRSSPGAARPRRWPGRRRSPRAGYMSTSLSAINRSGLSFHTLRGGVGPAGHHICPRGVRVV